MNNAGIRVHQYLCAVFLLVLLVSGFSSNVLAKERLSTVALTALNPFDVVALNNKAVVRVENNDYKGALILLERAARIAPYNAEVQTNYGRLKQWLAFYQEQSRFKFETDWQGKMVDADKRQNTRKEFIPEPPDLW